MIMQSTRTTGLVLVFGFFFFISCTVTSLTLDAPSASLQDGDYAEALEGVNRYLLQDPVDAEALLLKARILSEFALAQERPAYRYNYYREMKLTLENLSSDLSPARSELRHDIVVNAWTREHEAGVRLIREARNNNEDPEFEPVLSHLDNAIVINPDSVVSWNLKASMYYLQGDASQAVQTLESASEHIDPMNNELLERLAFLYLEAGDLGNSVASYEALYNQNPENQDYLHGLLNAYILNNNHQESIELLREQVEISPENIMYREALATELHFLIQSELVSLSGLPNTTNAFDERIEQVIEHINEARTHVDYSLANPSNPDDLTLTCAVFLTSTANSLVALADRTDEEQSEILSSLAHNMMEESVPLWETMIENSPENSDYRNNLSNLNDYLGRSTD